MNIRKLLSIIIVTAIILSVSVTTVCAAKFVSSVDITVNAPVTGSVATKSVQVPTSSDYEVVQVAWQDIDDGHRVLSEGETFKAGHVYVLGVSMKALNGKVFSEERTTITVNGGKTDWYVSGGTDGVGQVAIVLHTFPKTTVGYATNMPVSGVDVPVTGQSPDWDVSCDWDGATVTAMGWQCVETGKTVFSYSDQSAKDEFVFQGGYTYKVAVMLQIKDGYELYTYFSASVNGQSADGKWSQQNKSAVIEYTFPICESEVVDSTPGDVNRDTKINLADVSLMLKYIAKWDVELDLVAADVNDDTKVNLGDVSLMLKYIAKWDVELK